ncbi:MAG: hypothetical protein WCF95_03640 [bacterium]
MQISNVQNTNFGAIRIAPKNLGKFTPQDLAEFTSIAKFNGAELEAGLITGDKFTLNIMAKERSEQEKTAMAQLLNYISEKRDFLTAELIADDIARTNVEKLGK